MKLTLEVLTLHVMACFGQNWQPVDTSGVSFLPRIFFGASSIANTNNESSSSAIGYVFGGGNGTVEFNDLYTFRVSGGQAVFTQIRSTEGTPPSKRDALALAAGDGFVAVVGGRSENRLVSDAFVLYDASSGAWTDHSANGTGPRFAAVAGAIGTRVYVFGGLASFGQNLASLNDLSRFDTTTKEWIHYGPQTAIQPRYNARTVVSGNKFIIYGGFNVQGSIDNATYLNSIDTLEVDVATGEGTWLPRINHAEAPNQQTAALGYDHDHDRLLLYAGGTPSAECRISERENLTTTNRTWVYTSTNGWTEINARQGRSVVALNGLVLDGSFYALGGVEIGCSGESRYITNVYRLDVPDPPTNSPTPAPASGSAPTSSPMPVAHPAASTAGRRVCRTLVAGGLPVMLLVTATVTHLVL